LAVASITCCSRSDHAREKSPPSKEGVHDADRTVAAVSAFNNAGFALFPDSLMRFRGDWLVNLVITTLVICGGLGFVVLTELGRARRHRRLSTHTRLVLGLTAALTVVATVLIWFIEQDNPRTLQPLGPGEALLASYFQAVTPRTAGFNTLDIGAMEHASLFLVILLMFVGGAPGGTAGGVKISTFSITVAVIWAMVRGAREPTLLRRRIPPPLVARAFSICLIGFLAVNVVAGLLLLTQGRELLPTLFETTSAFGTVGLSMGDASSRARPREARRLASDLPGTRDGDSHRAQPGHAERDRLHRALAGLQYRGGASARGLRWPHAQAA
jgi:Trk-type K+ transport system membrane component